MIYWASETLCVGR